MKKAIYLLMLCAGVLMAACEKDEIGGTATQAMAGEWYVTVDAVDDAGNTYIEDPFGLGHVLMNTYNTAANVPTEMYVNDNGMFWEYAVVVNTDMASLTFSTDGFVPNEAYECNVSIEDGKIMYGAATTPHGTPADSIVYYVSFDDDPYPAAYGYSKYKVSGYRYTGLVEDD